MNARMVVAVLVCLAACSETAREEPQATSGAEPGTASVFVTNYPLHYFAQRIGGDRVDATFPAPTHEDPAFWEPDAETVVAYQQADLILLNGATYEKWVQQMSLPSSKLVDTSAGFRERHIPIEEAVTHSHGLGGEHEHRGSAFTTWLDPTLAVEQADAVRAALVRLRPQQESLFQSNFESLKRELLDLDARMATLVNGETPLVFSHPVYQYLIRRYGLKAQSVHWEPDGVPSAEAWKELEQRLAKHPARWMVWEADPNAETVKRLQALGMQSVTFDPCANVPDDGDLMTVMRQNVENLSRVFGAEGE